MDDARRHHVYTLWASMKGDDSGAWMIAAEDEFAWEGDPERCEGVFKAARTEAESQDFEVREVTLLLDYGTVMAAFEPTETEAEVEPNVG